MENDDTLNKEVIKTDTSDKRHKFTYEEQSLGGMRGGTATKFNHLTHGRDAEKLKKSLPVEVRACFKLTDVGNRQALADYLLQEVFTITQNETNPRAKGWLLLQLFDRIRVMADTSAVDLSKLLIDAYSKDIKELPLAERIKQKQEELNALLDEEEQEIKKRGEDGKKQ